MANEVITVKIDTAGSSGISSGGSGVSAGGSIGLGATLGPILGVANLTNELLKEMLFAFKPVLTVLKIIAKLIGSTLQPIAEVIVILLRPLIDIMRPFFQVFKAMMAPFMNVIREMGTIAQAQAQSGDTSGALETSLLIAKTAFYPLMVAMGGIIAEMLGTVLLTTLGETFASLFETLGSLLGSIIGIIFPQVGADIQTSMNAIADSTRAGFSNFSEALGSSIRDMTTGLLAGLAVSAEAELANLKEETKGLMQDYGDVAIVEPLETVTENTTASTDKLQEGLTTSFESINSKIDEELNSADSNIPSKFGTGLDSISNSTSEFVNNMSEKANEIESLLSKAKKNEKDTRIQFGLVNIMLGGQ